MTITDVENFIIKYYPSIVNKVVIHNVYEIYKEEKYVILMDWDIWINHNFKLKVYKKLFKKFKELDRIIIDWNSNPTIYFRDFWHNN